MAYCSGEPSTSRESSTTTKDIPRLITSFGPAGSKLSVRQAGENILKNFCHGYPDTDVHSIIPNFFSGNITELMDPRPNITRKEEERRRGREINQEGEKHENEVFNLFSRLIRQTDISPSLLIMHTFEMDTKNPVGLKRMALMSELPGLNLKSAITNAENDFVVLVKDCGVVFIEVKGSTKDNNVRSAEKQLKNVKTIVQSLMKTITGNKDHLIPTIKLIVIPDCADTSPEEKTPQGSYFLFKDSCDNFKQKWKKIVGDLIQLKSSNPFSSAEFKELSQVLVGIWSANAVCVMKKGAREYQLTQNEGDVSYVKQVAETDRVVDTSNVRNETQFKLQEEKLNPVTDIVRTTEKDIFRSCNDIKLCYLTPTQKEIFGKCKQALIHGVAGSGKSLLLIFKVLELVSSSSSPILILVPSPHDKRVYNFLQSNNVLVDIIEKLPAAFYSPNNVFVMDIKKFFKVYSINLAYYNITDFHILVDDMQHMELSWEGNRDHDASFFDVGDFIQRAFWTCVQYNTYCWFMLDALQGNSLQAGGEGSTGAYSNDLFLGRDGKPRTYDIPIIQLQHVMRNSHEVVQLTNEIREKYASGYDLFSLPKPQIGHRITSRLPFLHKLKHDPNNDAWSKYKFIFIIVRLREELNSITNSPCSLTLANVAIIWDDSRYLSRFKKSMIWFLKEEYHTTPQSIEEQLASNNKKDIIMDELDNIMSFESPIVLFIHNGGYHRYCYNICTRARVSLTIIDVSNYPYFDEINNIITVKWKLDDEKRYIYIKDATI